jgi:hypothetical protein
MTTSLEERQKIAQKLLVSAPPDAFDVILSNLNEILLPSPPLSDDVIQKIQMQRPAAFNHHERLHGDIDDFGKEMEQALQSHIQKFYSNPHVQVTHSVTPAKEQKGGYQIFISAQRIRYHQFNIGSWIGTYTLFPMNNSYVVSGTMDIHTQAFEGQGNIQNTSRFLLSEATVKNHHAESILEEISKFETDCMNQLNSVYDETGDQLKKLRRIMPITRQKFSWNVSGQKGIHELGRHLRLVKK